MGAGPPIPTFGTLNLATSYPDEKSPANANTNDPEKSHSDDDSDSSKEDVQDGVKKIEAMASVWTKRDLYIAYFGIFVVFFFNSLQQQTIGNLYPYVTSSFGMHSLVSTISIVSQLVGGVLKLPTAKLLDMWGRGEGFVIMLTFSVIGIAMMAGCTSVYIYAGAQVFYWVGYNGMGYILNVFMADTSSLENRALAFAFSTTPFIATTFAGPNLAQRFVKESTWQWGHGVWAIVLPFICIPFLTILFMNQAKAKRTGVLTKTPEALNRTWQQSCIFWFWEFDFIGVILCCAGFILVLLPMSLASYQRNTWGSPTVICMLVFGVVTLILFGLYEKFSPHKSFIPWELLKDRTVLGACGLSCTIFISFYCWDAYYSSYLQVVHNLSIQNAGYVISIYNIGACFFSIFVALFIKYTRQFKYLTLCFAVPLYIMATGLMIHFRQPHSSIGYIIMCQILISVAGGTLVICEQLAVMATSNHQNVAGVLAFLGLFSSIGGGIGSAVSGAIWTNTLSKNMYRLLPETAKPKYLTIYGSLVVQLSYPWGSPERDAIITAYGETQRLMVIAATVVMGFSFVWVSMWRNIKLDKVSSNKGLVF